MKKYFLIFLAGFFLLVGCNSSTKNQQNTSVISVIFETDMGNDVDDALALDMIYKYMETWKLDLLAVMSNKNSEYSAEFIDIMNTWYGHPSIPIGIVENGAECASDAVNYAHRVCEMNRNGAPIFARTLSNHEVLPVAPTLYRKILAQQPDHSVTIVSVGFSTNIARLLDTKADEYSPLNGKDLVAAKVKLLSVMAGSFGENPIAEYNVVTDIPAAQKVFSEWPTPIVASPFEVGFKINYPATSIENDFNWGMPHPMVEAYKAYLPMPYDRPTWDLTSVLYAVEGAKNYFTLSEWGRMEADADGHTWFYPDKNGKHAYLTVNKEQVEIIKNRFVELISAKPKNK